MPIEIEKFNALNQNEVISFLSKYENTSIFLLGNLSEHGPVLGMHANSGNLKLLRQDGKIICVFCLTRRGNLLVQSELTSPVFGLIVASCKEESLPLRGVIGDWKFSKDFWQYLKDQKIIKKENFYSKEINYTLNLDTLDIANTKEAKFLEVGDYLKWKALRMDYLLELNLPNDLTNEEMHEQFIVKCKKLMIWGLFEDSKLISMAELNAKTNTLGTVGGVYTMPQLRKQGFAKKLMEKLIFDCKNQIGLKKLIIFTGEEENKPAQKLYESLGCDKVGYMALFFGE